MGFAFGRSFVEGTYGEKGKLISDEMTKKVEVF